MIIEKLMRIRKSKIKNIILIAVLFYSMTACAPLGKPSYLKEWEKTPNKNRWEVVEFDPKDLSAEEKAVFKELGKPKFLIHFWSSPDKKSVYQWIYETPLRFYRFIDGKRAEDVHVREYNPWWR